MSRSEGGEGTVLVTGASSGIGKAIARRLLGEDWVVYGAARRVGRMADLEAEGARVLPLDLTDDRSVTAAVETLLGAEGRIDALVNNAGYGSYGALEDVDIDEARRQFEVNVFGAMRLTQLVLPVMRNQRSGTVVNVTSMGGRIWTPAGGWYHATKHAMEVLSDVLRLEVAPFGVHVVVVEPGAIESEWSDVAADHLEAQSRDTAYGDIVDPMVRVLRSYDRAASPDVVAEVVARAVRSPRPRRRYATPLDARVLIFLRWLLPEWAWERLMRAFLRYGA